MLRQGLDSLADQLDLNLARALVPPPRLRAKRVGISAPLRRRSRGLAAGLLEGNGVPGLLRIPAPMGYFYGAALGIEALSGWSRG